MGTEHVGNTCLVIRGLGCEPRRSACPWGRRGMLKTQFIHMAHDSISCAHSDEAPANAMDMEARANCPAW